MPLIEGVGDEVVQFFAVMLILLIGIVSWLSTGLSDRQIIRTVLILERRSRHRVPTEVPVTQPSTATTSIEGSIDTGQVEPETPIENLQSEVVVCHTCDKENNSSESSSSGVTNQPPSEVSETSVCDFVSNACNVAEATTSGVSVHDAGVEELSTSVQIYASESADLRRRRLAFFQSRQATLLDHPDSDHLSSSSASIEGNVDAAISDINQVGEEESPEQSNSSAIPSSEGNIRIRLKYLNDDQKLVEGRLEEQLGEFKRRHFALEMAADKLVRLIFNGQVLQSDSETLQDYGLFDNCVVHCLVHKQRSPRSPGVEGTRNPSSSGNGTTGEGIQREWDLGNVLFLTLGIMIGLAWYFRYQYSHFFNATTTVALVGLTGILAVSLIGIYMPDTEGIRQS